MIIPDKIKILGHEYKVELKPDLVLEADVIGQCCPNTLKIEISSAHPESRQTEVFLHEVIEALNSHIDLDLKHEVLTALSEGIFQVLRDNNLNLACTATGGDND